MRMSIPRRLDSELRSYTHQPAEINGALIYYNYDPSTDNADDLFISAYWLTGQGNAGHVSGNQRKMSALMSFLKRNPRFDYTIFHTHTVDTIRRYGDYYARNFSSGDLETIRQNKARMGQHWWETLITPEATIFSEPGIRLVVEDWVNDNGSSWEETNRYVMSELHRLERSL